MLGRVIVAPLTRTVRGIPTEIPFSRSEGLPDECAASFDNLQPVSRRLLTARITTLDATGRSEICAALDALADC